jgi:hypothetical protein
VDYRGLVKRALITFLPGDAAPLCFQEAVAFGSCFGTRYARGDGWLIVEQRNDKRFIEGVVGHFF